MLIFEQWKAITSAFKYFCLAFAIFSLLWRRCRMWWPPNKRSCAPVAQKRRVNHVHILLIARDVQLVLSRLIPFDGTSFVLLDDPKWRWNANYRPSTVKSCQFYELKYHEKYDCILNQEWQKINEKCSSPEFEKADNSDYWYPIQARDKTDFLVISLPSVNENPFCKKVYGLV